MGNQPRCLRRADSEEHFTASDQQLVAQLERLGEIRLLSERSLWRHAGDGRRGRIATRAL